MDEHYFSISAYNSILGILGEVDPALTEQFATFFTLTPDGKYYQCVNYNGYMGFLSELFAGEQPDDEFVNWATFTQGKSTQGGGVL